MLAEGIDVKSARPACLKPARPTIFFASSTAALALVAMLAACGGGGGSSSGSSPITAPQDDVGLPDTTATRRLAEIERRTDSLLIPSHQSDMTIRLGNLSETTRTHERFRCAGVSCSGVETGISLHVVTEGGLIVVPRDATLGSRAGFDTATYQADAPEAVVDTLNAVPGLRVDRFPSATTWGFWGEHGQGAVSTTRGDFSGRFDGTAFSGTMATVLSFAAGEATGTNPAGIGSATWEGIAEAASRRSYERRQGTAHISIPDLSRPFVDADIRIDDQSIGSWTWRDMPLINGSYGNTFPRDDDFIRGKFHGPDHEETYGVFDSGMWIGAFGAKRE